MTGHRVTSRRPLVVVGDALLDRDVTGTARRLCPDAPAPVLDELTETRRPGGAALAALLAARGAGPVLLVAPFGADPGSAAVRELLPPAVTVLPLPLDGPMPDKTRYRAGGQTLLRADGPAGRPGPATEAALASIAAAGTVLVSDYGRGVTEDPRIRAALAARAAEVPLVWDPHPRGAAPVPGTRLATPNLGEALAAAGLAEAAREPAGAALLRSAASAAGRLLERWPADGIAVTLGHRGALLAPGGPAPLLVPARPVPAADTCGAGDRFAAAAAVALAQGALPSEAVTTATGAAAEFLAAGGVAALRPGSRPAAGRAADDFRDGAGAAFPAGDSRGGAGPVEAVALARATRAAGGTVVAAGGCFDLLHTGHVSLLQTARSLGDCLIVCLNSDESVRRRKGGGRPVNPAADRAAVLRALDCVDAVLVFAEDTPEAALRRLRPDLWVKGGDYHGQQLPEAALLGTWGGQAVTVPYLAGRSSSRLLAASTQPG
jgi:D-beta-D-heptose 7-phosphate kinase / D-beta-D-heptose 1-phosphate adenosyltransferase